ncbi:MAG TPA: hypothetical protein VJB97_04405 [Candidatus Paceibacterota bacterium]
MSLVGVTPKQRRTEDLEMRAILLAISLLVMAVPASAATLGEVIDLSKRAAQAGKSHCPAEKPTKPGEFPDMARFTCLMKFEGVKSGTLSIMMHSARTAMDECLRNLQSGKRECPADNDKYRAYRINAAFDKIFTDIKAKYESYVREYRR